MTSPEMDAIFEQALAQEIGVKIEASDPVKLQKALFDYKRTHPRYAKIAVAITKSKALIVYHARNGVGLD